MKLSNFSIPVLRDAFMNAISRFPLALISAFAFALVSIYLIESEDKTPEMQRILFCLGIGLPWLTGLHLLSEQYFKSSSQKLVLFILGIAFLVFIFIYISPDFNLTSYLRPVRFLSFFLIAHLLVSLAPFFRNNSTKEFWEFNKETLCIWFVGAFYVLLIYIGLMLGLVAIDNLFEIRLDYELYLELFVILSACFHPVYVLSNLPKSNQTDSINQTYTKAIRNLCLYVLIPLTILYFFILYAYGLKIVVSWELPKGWVSSLVLGFSGTGLITYLLNYHLPDLDKSKLSILFKKYFFYILAPLVILLFTAIYRRLSDYGFTPPRYFVLITGIWLLLSCLYFIFSKTDNIKLIPLSLILFLLVGTISPFDAFNVSSSSQLKRLQNLLAKNGALENGKIKSPLPALDIADKESIRDIIYIMNEIGHIEKVNTLLSEPIPFDTISNNNPAEIVLEKTGLTYSGDSKFHSDVIYLSGPDKNDYAVSGFDRIFLFNLNKGGSDENIRMMEEQGNTLIMIRDIKDTINLNDILQKLDDHYKSLNNSELTDTPYDISTELNSYRLYINRLNYQKSKTGISVDYIQGALLMKKK